MLHRLLRVAKAWADGSLIDPLEVFYQPESGEIYPINSKAGCSTVKLLLIRQYVPHFKADYPGIHHVDPASVTSGKLERHYFYSHAAYDAFCAAGRVRLIIREPAARISSTLKGIRDGRILLYDHPARLGSLTRRLQTADNTTIIKLLSLIPDRMADRHFRSQSALLPTNRGLDEVDLITLEDFTKQHPANAFAPTLNASPTGNEETGLVKTWLADYPRFHLRYAKDVKLYEIAGKATVG